MLKKLGFTKSRQGFIVEDLIKSPKGKEVGFVSKISTDPSRLGYLHIYKHQRGKGYASSYLKGKTKKGDTSIIAISNKASQEAFRKAGFKPTGKFKMLKAYKKKELHEVWKK